MNLCVFVACLVATSPEQHYRVGVAHFPPMIVVNSKTGAIGGSDYEMFELLASDPDIALNKSDYEYVVASSFGALMSMVEAGEVDIAIDGISITHDRLQKLHFTQPYKNSGQRIMIPYAGEIRLWSHITTYVGQFFRLEILFAFVAFLINCFVWGILIYFAERIFSRRRLSSSDDTTKLEPNIRTIEDGTLAAYDAGTTIGYGRFFPVTRIGQIVGAAAFFCGAIVVGNVISTLTTDKIVNRLEGEINGPDDLKGKIVAVVDGTTSERLINEYNPSQVLECDDFYKAVVEMRLGNAEAVMADDPVVLNYVKENPTHGSVVGSKFHPEDYGIAFRADVGGDLVKKFSIAIARLRESGKLALIEKQWYGE